VKHEHELGWKLACGASMKARSLSFNEVLQWLFYTMEMQRKAKEKRRGEAPTTRE